jgi:hypothetical protein
MRPGEAWGESAGAAQASPVFFFNKVGTKQIC